MKKFLLLCVMLFAFAQVWAQERTISGKVISEEGESLPGVNVVLKGTNKGAVTDFDGNYKLSVPSDGGTLVFSFIGLKTQEVEIGSKSAVDVTMAADATQLNEVVVTALGIEREERSLGYSVQEVSGDEVSQAKEGSFISALSGKVAGLNVTKSGQIGGSVNAVIRGSNSFTGNNQALFVVDGIPISNSTLTSPGQNRNRGGYDYGNAASDIDPDMIESVSVLKGATASALYGSDAANGVILITTKKGKSQQGLGVTVNHATTFSKYDPNTFPEYQKEYGQGYGPYYGSTGGFYDADINGDGTLDLIVPVGEDASFGAAYDPDLMVYQWDSFFPQLDSYLQPSPYVAAENGPASIFQTGVSNVSNVSLQGGNEFGSFRAGYSHDDRQGILPNSNVTRDVIDLHASYNFTDKFSMDGKVSYIKTEGRGRYGTGYDGLNIMQSFKQWFATNVDVQDQKDAYFATGDNITWNSNSHNDLRPHYFDNPYWVLHENYQTDNRNRFFGKFATTYELTDGISAMARFGVDSYSDLQEERMAVGSLDQPYYRKFQRTFEEYNTDLILTFDRNLTDDLSLTGLVGMSIKNRNINSTRSSTNGGLVVKGLYSLSNSVSALNPPSEFEAHIRKYGYYGQAALGYKDMFYLDATLRYDHSSTLPEEDNVYAYPSLSGSFIFSELMDVSWLNLGKIRAGWATVRGDADPYSIQNTFAAASPFGSTPVYFVGDQSNNPNLRPEETTEKEVGLELQAFNNRLGLDVSVYQKNTVDQILPVQISTASGFNKKFVNAGEMENKGIEIALSGSPIVSGDLQWRVNVNWARNVNEVVSLFEGGENLLIYSNWSTAVNARVGQPYGAITGTNYVFHENGGRIVGSDGKYLRTSSTTEVIGNIQPDWNGGINNTISYKNVSFSFLLDGQKGGDIVTYDMGFGQATGLYATTAGLNAKGNPKRDFVSEGGGVLVDGVKADGTPNDVYAEAYNYLTPYGYYGGSSETGYYAPDAQLVYDASFIKLREVVLSYTLPSNLFSGVPVNSVTLGAFGRNLWIIHKNLPYGDPEYIPSAGNVRGIQNGALPSTNEYGFNVKVQF